MSNSFPAAKSGQRTRKVIGQSKKNLLIGTCSPKYYPSRAFLALLLFTLSTGGFAAQSPAPGIDKRVHVSDHSLPIRPAQEVLAEVEQFKNRIPDLTVRHNPKTGGVNTLFSLSQALTTASDERPSEIARQFVENNRVLFALDNGDIQESRIRREYISSIEFAISGIISRSVLSRWSATETPFISASHLFTRRKRRSVSMRHKPTGAES